ncbi:hypothetical protein, partial [Thiocapsa imhoffii]|uniref:hypothetical protein n=1 Tax=Thiocapsa imhoffii TaxID=382777 RepID=UPI001F5BEEAF
MNKQTIEDTTLIVGEIRAGMAQEPMHVFELIQCRFRERPPSPLPFPLSSGLKTVPIQASNMETICANEHTFAENAFRSPNETGIQIRADDL